MITKKITEQDIENAEKQIKKLQIPYEYDTKEYPVEVLLYKFNSEIREESEIIIPTYQRGFIWDDDRKSRFIESLFLGVPIQPLFAATLHDGTLELIDGSQRLRTIEAFTKDEFKLRGLKKIPALNGLVYSNFSPATRRKFGLINLRLHVITERADLSVRQDIFDRINTSAMQANAPEIRKGALAGEFYSFVMECAQNELFNKLCPITEQARVRGETEELILRFFTYADYGTNNKDKGIRLMDKYLIEQNEKGFDKSEKKKDFERMLNFVDKYFPLGFRKSSNSKFTPRVRFEAISLGIHFALNQKPDLKPSYMDWLNSEDFEEVTTSDSSTNPGKLTARVNFVSECLLNKTKKNDLTYEES